MLYYLIMRQLDFPNCSRTKSGSTSVFPTARGQNPEAFRFSQLLADKIRKHFDFPNCSRTKSGSTLVFPTARRQNPEAFRFSQLLADKIRKQFGFPNCSQTKSGSISIFPNGYTFLPLLLLKPKLRAMLLL